MRENSMQNETRIRARGHTASDVTREMLGLAVDALVTGAAAAIIAGGLVVMLTMHSV